MLKLHMLTNDNLGPNPNMSKKVNVSERKFVK